MTPRTVLASATAGVSAAGSAYARLAQARKTFVLVHGPWHGAGAGGASPTSSRRKATRSTRDAHRLGDRSHLMSKDINLDTHIADIVT